MEATMVAILSLRESLNKLQLRKNNKMIIGDLLPYSVSIRSYLHRDPELGFQDG